MFAPPKFRPMGKKKSDSGKNKTPRKPVQMPTVWLEVARARAREARQPVLWYLISLIEKDVRDSGAPIVLPAMPWDHTDDEATDPQDEAPAPDADDAAPKPKPRRKSD